MLNWSVFYSQFSNFPKIEIAGKYMDRGSLTSVDYNECMNLSDLQYKYENGA